MEGNIRLGANWYSDIDTALHMEKGKDFQDLLGPPRDLLLEAPYVNRDYPKARDGMKDDVFDRFLYIL